MRSGGQFGFAGGTDCEVCRTDRVCFSGWRVLVSGLCGGNRRDVVKGEIVDPNENLAEVRALVRELTRDECRDRPFDANNVSRLVELIFALDDWMSHGGFLPEVWER